MSINVYWTLLEETWLGAEEPQPVFKKFMNVKGDNSLDVAHKCPAVQDAMKNTFEIKSTVDYSMKFFDDKIQSKHHDQKFFEDHVFIRDLKRKNVSFVHKYIFFTDEKSLLLEGQVFPFLENNEITKRTFFVPGKFDIGKWFRPVEFAFYMKDGYDEFIINENDVYSYVRFFTDKKINFKKFIPTMMIYKFANSSSDLSKFSSSKNSKKLNDYYTKFNYKKRLLKEIKENLCE